MSTLKYLVYAAVVLATVQVLAWRRRVRKLPPGPPKLPLVDNLFNMPVGLDCPTFTELGRKYDSDIIHFSALGTSIVVLNSFEAAIDLLEQRSGIYSSRPVSVMTHELTEFYTFLTSMVYGDRWRAGRRLFAKYFVGGSTINQSRDIYYIRRFLNQLLERPEDFRHHIGTLLSAISLSMTYGIRPQGDSDPYVKVSEEAVSSSAYLISQAPYMVDLIPWLKYLPTWFPGAIFHKDAAKCSRSIRASRETLFGAGTAVMASADYTPSFLSQALQSIEGLSPGEAQHEEKLIKDVANIVYLAAFDTSVSGIETFFLAMACYPDIQRKAQEELDAALKGRLLPEHSDLESLPYLTALVMELLRWKPATPAGVPHTVILDDVYKGYFIPRDSMIIANQWGMLQDPEVYPEPSEFKPERYLKGGKINDEVRKPTDITFGFGRRACPGRHIAQATLKMTVASVLLMFDVQKSVDAEGRVIEPNREYNMDLISKAKELSCTIKPRSRVAVEAIKTWISVEGDNPP